MQLSDPGLENQWVRLDVFGAADREIIASSGAIKSMWEWMPRLPGRGTTFEAYYEFVMAETKAGRIIPMLAHRKIDNAFAGGVAYFHPNRTHRRVEIAFPWLMPDMRGSHLFSAIQHLLIQRARDWRALRISWTVDSRNGPLLTALERMGVPQEGVLRSYNRLNNGNWSDAVIHALVRDEIEEALARLEALLSALD